ncbi:type II secretion system F family protein [Pseudaeromonas sharmana]|uniref:Type II secretion system F family protein n=1 Tax=Pseudaeromonas sharmana TaxID=328412 RepID=A0ABV8CK19_9GAMM
MPTYQYQGRNGRGEAVNGAVDAPNEMAAAEILMRRGILPTALRAGKAARRNIEWSQLLEGGVDLEDLVMFTRQMYALTKAGIPIMRAIHGLAESSHNKPLRKALLALEAELGNGRPLSQAMQSHPRIFSSLFIAIIHVGENTGRLEEAFLQLSNYFSLELETRKRIKAALRYPLMVIMAIAIALVILNLKVIPVFASMFAKFGVELPLMTRFLLGMSALFVNWWWLMAAGVILIVGGWSYWIRTPSGRLIWGRWQMKMPIIGSIITRSLLARFARSFAMMLRAGVPLNQALSLVADAVDNAHVALRIRDMRSGVERGESLLRCAAASQLFTQLVMQMFAVGEETGQVEELMQEAADYYEREVDYDLKTLTARIEPILLVIVACMVLVLALGIFTPMWDMFSAVQGKGH